MSCTKFPNSVKKFHRISQKVPYKAIQANNRKIKPNLNVILMASIMLAGVWVKRLIEPLKRFAGFYKMENEFPKERKLEGKILSHIYHL